MYTLYRGGYDSKHDQNFIMSRPNGHFCYVLLIVKSQSDFQIGNDYFHVLPNSAILIRPGTPYQYAPTDREFRNDWLHFDTSDPLFSTHYNCLLHHPILLNTPLQFSQYIQHIFWEMNFCDPEYRAENISMLLHILLNKLLQEKHANHQGKKYNPYANDLQNLRLEMNSRPNKNYSPGEMAEKINISPSYFQSLYKELFGIPFKKDLINMRLDYARDLITDTQLPLEQIALLSGYNNEVHFYRQFKEKTGMTPREYQQSTRHSLWLEYPIQQSEMK